ncbi:MAG: hypothetical protein GC206_13260 [Alphaproteobacteria bacterium]|nr:hypothetical protein [Alphaproteobacteria bacterium]
MPCISRTPAHPLTPMQSANLILLLKKGALGEANARTIYELRAGSLGYGAPNTLVIGALCDKGLAGRRATSRKRQRVTLYWLTPDGVARAQSEKAKAANARKAATGGKR